MHRHASVLISLVFLFILPSTHSFTFSSNSPAAVHGLGVSDSNDFPDFPDFGVDEFAPMDFTGPIPIEQINPKRLRADLLGMKINEYGDYMPYWHGYPELMGYVRLGNGQPEGDDGYFVLSSIADASGVGSVFVEFPPRRNTIDRDSNGGSLGAFDGLFHPLNRPYVRGYDLFIMSDSIFVNFGPEFGPRYTVQLPVARATTQGHYVTYHAPAGTRNDFLINRKVIYGTLPSDGVPYPIPPPREPDSPRKGEL